MIVCGVDSSTQSCTVALYDTDTQRLVGVGQAPHPATTPPISEQHPNEWWIALSRALSLACSDAGITPAQIDSISIAAQYSALVVVGPDGQALRAAKLWNDTSTASQTERLLSQLPIEEWVEIIGGPPTPALTVSKLAWLAEFHHDDFARAIGFCTPHDWLTSRLTGRLTTDRADASGTGYFDLASGAWSDRILGSIDSTRTWIDLLPEILGPNDRAGYARTSAAKELGLTPDTIVACGTGDQAAAALSLGIEKGDIVISLGTSGTVYGYTDSAPSDPSGALTITANACGGYLPIAVLLNAAKVTDTFARLLATDHEELSALALSADPLDESRPVFAAYLDGERSPNLPTARGLLAGLTSSVTRPLLALSIYEGVVLGLERGYKALLRAGVSSSGRLLVTGGASKSPAYREVIARVFSRDVWSPAQTEMCDTARGAAIQATAVATSRATGDVAIEWRPEVRQVASSSVESDWSWLRKRYEAVSGVRQLDEQ